MPPKRPDVFDEEDGEHSSNEDQKTGVAKGKGRSKTPSPKKKVKGESAGASPGRAAAIPWSKEEEGAVFRAAAELALANLPLISKSPGLEVRNGAQVNMKYRAMIKSVEKTMGWGDGKWVDEFKIAKKQE